MDGYRLFTSSGPFFPEGKIVEIPRFGKKGQSNKVTLWHSAYMSNGMVTSGESVHINTRHRVDSWYNW